MFPVPPDVITASVSRSGTVRAGMVYNLSCTVARTVGGLVNSPTATWTTGGVAVSNGNNITVSRTTNYIYATSTLTFDPLRTSHEARYICEGTLTSPALETTLMPTAMEDLRVQSKLYCIAPCMSWSPHKLVHELEINMCLPRHFFPSLLFDWFFAKVSYTVLNLNFIIRKLKLDGSYILHLHMYK